MSNSISIFSFRLTTILYKIGSKESFIFVYSFEQPLILISTRVFKTTGY